MSDSSFDSPRVSEEHAARRPRTLTRSDSRSSLPESLIADCCLDLDPNLKFVETEHSLLQKYPFYRKESKLLVLEADDDDAEEEGEPEWDGIDDEDEEEQIEEHESLSVHAETSADDVKLPTWPQSHCFPSALSLDAEIPLTFLQDDDQAYEEPDNHDAQCPSTPGAKAGSNHSTPGVLSPVHGPSSVDFVCDWKDANALQISETPGRCNTFFFLHRTSRCKAS
jgi:hypothetical protein